MGTYSIGLRSDLIGKIFSNLKVISFAGVGNKKSLFNCECSCGNKLIVRRNSLITGNTKSCGCLKGKGNTKHGHATVIKGPTKEYTSWANMIVRCEVTTNPGYKRYGGRGIKVCERWRTSFQNFIDDMGLKPSPKHQIERRDNDKNYEPANCYWASQLTQANNKSSNILVSYKGHTKTLGQWCSELNLPYFVVHSRLRINWSVDDAFNKPVHSRRG